MVNPHKAVSLSLSALCLSLTVAGCAPATPAPTGNTPRTVALSDCVLGDASAQAQVNAQCGTLSVPEDRSQPGGRRIALRIAVIPAVSRSPEPDPLFLLAGGPGQAASEAFPAEIGAFEQINQERDLVLVDQRGTGQSNPLRCFDPKDERVLDEAQVITELKRCPAKLNADLRQYTTEIAMQDLDAVRAALGYARLNLYGASYGTRAALTYLRLYPDRVRAVILDAVVDADFRLLLSSAQDGQRALEQVFARCQADSACQAAFPDVAAEFTTLLQRLDAEPVALELPNPATGKPLPVKLTRAYLANAVYSALYAPEFVALLPLTIHTAYAAGNYAPLVAQAASLDAGIYDGLLYSVACAEDAPLITEQAAAAAANATFGDETRTLRAVCADWPRGAVSAQFRQPVHSAAPVLLLSGGADPITPPQYAAKVAETLPNSLQLVAPGMGHGTLIRGCASRLATAFIRGGALQGLDGACMANIAPPPFFITFTGPQP